MSMLEEEQAKLVLLFVLFKLQILSEELAKFKTINMDYDVNGFTKLKLKEEVVLKINTK